MATHSFKIDPSAPWEQPAEDQDSAPADEGSQQFSGLGEAGFGGYVVSTDSAAFIGSAAEASTSQPSIQQTSERPSLAPTTASQPSQVPAITLVEDEDETEQEAELSGGDLQRRGFSNADDGEISAKSLIIARPKNPIVDRALPVAIGLGLLMLLTFIFTEGLKVETWRSIVTILGEGQPAEFDSFVAAQIDQTEARVSQSLPKPQLMANPYYFLPVKAKGEEWPILKDRRPNLFEILKTYERRDALGRYQLLRKLRQRPHRGYAPIFTKALGEQKLWLKMEAVRGLISIDQPIPIYDLERRMAVVSPRLFRRYIRRLSPQSSLQDRVLVRSLIKADLPWLRSSLLPLLKFSLGGRKLGSSMAGIQGRQLDRLYLAGARYDKNPKVRKLSQNRQKDPAADEAYQKVWYLDLSAIAN